MQDNTQLNKLLEDYEFMRSYNLNDIWFPYVQKSMAIFGQAIKKKSLQAKNNEQLKELIDNNGFINTLRHFYKHLFTPNEYMEFVLMMLEVRKCGSVSMLAKWKPQDNNDSIEDYEGYIRRELKKLVELNILVTVILNYTTPKPTAIYVAPFAYPNDRIGPIQIKPEYWEWVEKNYESDKGAWEKKLQAEKAKKEVLKIEKIIKYEGKKEAVPDYKYQCPTCGQQCVQSYYQLHNRCLKCDALYEVIE